MSKVIVDALTSEKLRGVIGEVAICDEAGEILGHFQLAAPKPPPGGWKSPFTDEEIQKRATRKGRPHT